MQTLSQEEQETLRAILRKVFEEATVDALLRALDRLAERQKQESANLHQLVKILQEAVRDLQGNVEQLNRGYASIAEGLARLMGVQTQMGEALTRLVEAQIRTEERLARLEEAIARLVEAQARTEERVARLEEGQRRLEEAIARLVEAQAQAEERLARMEEAQARAEERFARLEEAIARLTEAQARTEERVSRLEETVARLGRAMEQMARQVGALSDIIGGDLEDAAYIAIHDVFTRELGWRVDVLERAFLSWDDHMLEVDIFGRAYDPARPKYEIWIVGEVKYNITVREVDRFAEKLPLVAEYLNFERGEKKERLIVPVCFCYRARPEVREKIYNMGFHLVFSYGRVIWGKEGPPMARRKRAASRKAGR